MSVAGSARTSSVKAVSVSVIVCTRNRQDNAAKAAAAILASKYRGDWELLLVDQSDGDSTERAVHEIAARDSRLRYVRQRFPGKPLALNAACKAAQGEILLLTDDDCEPKPGWMEAMIAPFADEKIGCVFGVVEAAPFDPKIGWIPYHAVEHTGTAHKLSDVRKIPGRFTLGFGANQALRTDIVRQVGGWDPCIGPGTRFRSGDDYDITTRICLAGYGVHFTPEASVLHYGLRPWAQRFDDPRRFGYGRGAGFAKYLRCGIVHEDSLVLLWRQYLSQLLFRPQRGGVRVPLNFMAGFAQGMAAGMRHPIDREHKAFRPVSDTERAAYGDQFANIVLRSEQK